MQIQAIELEVWRSVPNFPAYEVSDLGAVRRIVTRGGRPCSRRLKPQASKGRAYVHVVLRREGESFTRDVHRLVCDAFLGSLPEGMHRSHINGNGADNRAANLCFEKPQSNFDRKHGHGTVLLGEKHPNAKLLPEQVHLIRHRVRQGETRAGVARAMGLAAATVDDIIAGRKWKHLPELEAA